jgi:hypothetical protein
MIKVKLGKNGGYVVGDGPCPFNPDEFMHAFMDKIMEAKRAGLTEIGFTDEDVDEMKQQQFDAFAEVPVVEVKQSRKAETNKKRLFAMLDTAYGAPLLEDVQL